MIQLELIEFFEAFNSFLSVCMNVLFIPIGIWMGFSLTQLIIKSIKEASQALLEDETGGKKKSYEEEMAVYDNETVQPLSLPTSLSLEDLLSEDGEIPDRFIQG